MNVLYKVDIYLSRIVNNFIYKNKIFSTPLKYITHTSDGKIYLLYAILIPFIVHDPGIDIITYGIIAFSFQVPVYLILKNTIKRTRPSIDSNIIQIIKPPDKYSFPSGHCASSFLFTLIINLYAPGLTLYFVIWMCAILLSRVGLGLHYISDVLSGCMLGFLSFLFAGWVYSIYF